MENFSLELIRAQTEALDLQKRAREIKELKNEDGTLTGENYENSDTFKNVPTLKGLLALDIVKRKEVVENLIEQYLIEEAVRKQKEIELSKEYDTYSGKAPDSPKIFTEVLRSIYDDKVKERLAFKIWSESGFDELCEQIRRKKPDIVFLLLRSAVPAGFAYKGLLKLDDVPDSASGSVKEILADENPETKFLLADCDIDKWHNETGDHSSFEFAVKSYEKKLEKIRFLSNRKNGEKLKIRLFDESIGTGMGLKEQTKAVEQACRNISLDADVAAFRHGASGEAPEIPLPISGIPKENIEPHVYTNPKAEYDYDSKEYKERNSLQYGGVHPKWRRLYEQQSIQLSKNAIKIHAERKREI